MFNFIKSFLFSIALVVIGILVMFIIEKVDLLLGLENFRSNFSLLIGIIFLIIGVVIRTWATLIFYQNRLKVVTLNPQHTFVKSGPYKFSRNPLYIGIISIALGSSLLFGSPTGVIAAILVFIGWDIYVGRVEEKRLERKFGDSYAQYKQEVPRWL